MKDVFLVYDRCCFYEIVILSYFLSCTALSISARSAGSLAYPK